MLLEQYFTEKEREIVERQVESDVSVYDFLDDTLSMIKATGLADKANIKKSTSKSAQITDTGSRTNRKNIIDALSQKDLATEVGTANDGSALYKIMMVDADGTVQYTIFLKQGGVGKSDAPNSTAFEENLANALNSAAGACKTKFVGAGEQFDELADQVVESIGSSRIPGGCFGKLSQNDVAVSKSYADQGVSSSAPKTDLISEDGSIKISVKKDISQFISSQGGETAAVFLAVLKNIGHNSAELGNKMAALIKKYFSYEQGISNLKALSPEERKKAKIYRNFLLQRIRHFGGSTLDYYLVREALLGEYKFAGGLDDPAVPNYFLVWSIDGSGELYEAERFVKYMASHGKFGVRGRGGTRGLAFRGDKAK